MSDKKPNIPFRSEIEFDYGSLRELAPGVRRLVANNPGPFTYKGTNCYILGEGSVGIIDPGPKDEAHIETVVDCLGGETVSHIILTHTHLDHSGSVARLKELTGATTYGFGPSDKPRGAGEDSPSGQDFADSAFTPDVVLLDGDVIEGEGWTLRAIHTPGHAPDHLCFDLIGHPILFSGDHVMSWNTSVIAPPEGHMGDYISSLEKLIDSNHEYFLPGHGGRVENPRRVVKAFLVHRGWREAAIVDAIKKGDRRIQEIVKTVYRDIDPKMAKAAELSVFAHVVFLLERGQLAHDGAPLDAPSLLSSYFLP